MYPALSTLDPERLRTRARAAADHAAALGAAHVYLTKSAGDARLSYGLAGRLVLSSSGWGLLEVPNALVRGAFDALHEPGAEPPPGKDGRLNAHISVLRPEDVAAIGGPDKISERGHFFHYTLGPVREVVPDGWTEMGKVWFIEVRSPELEKLRKSYGLSPTPKDGKHPFHITLGVRRRSVLRDNEVRKAAGVARDGPGAGAAGGLAAGPVGDPGGPVPAAGAAGAADAPAADAAVKSARDVRHVLVTGVSGAGKSTLAAKLATRLDLPLVTIDHDRVWRDNKDIADDPERYTEGTGACRRFRRLRKKLVHRALGRHRPSVIEGAQLLVDPGLLAGQHVVVLDADEDTAVRQRLCRDKDRGKLAADGGNKGEREDKARYLYRHLKPLADALKGQPGVEVVTPAGADDWLARQTRAGLLKEAATAAMKKKRPPTVAVDVDGTLAENRVGEPYDPTKFGPPRQDYLDLVRKLHAAGVRILINTVRGDTGPVEAWLEAHDVPFDCVNENPDQPDDASDSKLMADAYLDDRGVDARQSAAAALAKIKEMLEADDPPPAHPLPGLTLGGTKEGGAAIGLLDDVVAAFLQRWRTRGQAATLNAPPARPALFAQAAEPVTQEKAASVRWQRLLQGGRLSPEATQRVTASMEPGKMRFVKSLGHGEFNQADLMAGKTQGGVAGPLVRKLPLKQLPWSPADHFQPAVEASRTIDRQAPGLTARYLEAGNRGLIQEYGDKQVLPPGPPALVNQAMHENYRQLKSLGLDDLSPVKKPENWGPGGQAIDYIYNRGYPGRTPFFRLDIGRTPPALVTREKWREAAGTPWAREDLENVVRKWWLGPQAVGRPTQPLWVAPAKSVEEVHPLQSLLAHLVQTKAGAAHGARAGVRYDGDRRVTVCPHCDRDLAEKDVYTDVKGWRFCRACFRKGKGALSMPKHADAALGGTAAGGSALSPPQQDAEPARPLTPAPDEAHLARCSEPPDPHEFVAVSEPVTGLT